jgi:dipeptidyl aminopeptidase/acylaminoacyl peptidase
MSMWVNVDEHNGVPSQPRPDVDSPPHWRLDAVAALGRPHHLVAAADGTEVAFVLDVGDASDVWVMAVDGSGLRRITTIRDPHGFWEDTPPAWSPDGTRVAFAEGGWVHVVAVAGGPPRRLVEGGSPQWLDDEHLLITVDRDRISRLCRIRVDDPWPVALTPADGHVWSVTMAPDGRRIAYVHAPRDDRRRSDLRLLDLGDGSVTTLVSDLRCFVGSPAFSPDGRVIAFTSERSGWSEVSLIDGGEERQVTSAGAGFSALSWHRDGRTLVAVRTRHGVDDLVTVDTASGEVGALAAGGTWSSPQWTTSGEVIAVYEDHATAPCIRSVAAGGGQTTRLSMVPAAIEGAPRVTPEVVSYRSFDGLEIPGFLFRPAAADDGRRPVVVYAHGGPTSHYGDEWDGHAQYFLDKGYGWFAINFRGSTSYGLEFEHADHGVWGVADTEDCLAAHDYLAGLDWVDAARIAIFGASYGSYMALAALARDPQHRFACGIAKYGDCDILTSWAQGDRVGIEDLERMMGHPSENRDGYREGSPIHWAADVERPLLIAHGEQDERVHPKQSQQLVDALRRHGKTFEYVTYPTEGHGLLRRGPQVHFYQRLERFLDWYLM